MPKTETAEIPPAIGLAIDEKFHQANDLQMQADRANELAKVMFKEYARAIGFIEEDDPFEYRPESRKIVKVEQPAGVEGLPEASSDV